MEKKGRTGLDTFHRSRDPDGISLCGELSPNVSRYVGTLRVLKGNTLLDKISMYKR